jgi:hypothetical protein
MPILPTLIIVAAILLVLSIAIYNEPKPSTCCKVEQAVKVDLNPDPVLPPDTVKEVPFSWKKYYRCKCGWSLEAFDTPLPPPRNLSGGETYYVQNTYISPLQEFKNNCTCPKCGADISEIPIQVGRVVRMQGSKYRIEQDYRCSIFNPVSGKTEGLKHVYASFVDEYLRFEWLEEQKLLVPSSSKRMA